MNIHSYTVLRYCLLSNARMGLRTWHTMTCGVKLCSGLNNLTTQIDSGLFNIYIYTTEESFTPELSLNLEQQSIHNRQTEPIVNA